MRLRPWSLGLAVCLAIGSTPWLLPCAGQPAPDTPRRTVTEGLPGVTIFSPQRWGIVGVTIANPSDTPAEVISAHSFSADPALQFARQVWIPPRAKRSSWYPVLPPQSSARGANLEVKSVLIDRSGTREILLRDTAAGGEPAIGDKSPGALVVRLLEPLTENAGVAVVSWVRRNERRPLTKDLIVAMVAVFTLMLLASKAACLASRIGSMNEFCKGPLTMSSRPR